MAADFKVYSNPLGATPRLCAIGGSTVIEEGDAVALSSGLIIKAVDASAALGIAAEAHASGGGSEIKVWNDPSMVFIGTADANFAATHRGAEVDLVVTSGVGYIDVGTSSTDVFKVEAGIDAGTVGSPSGVLVRLNKTI